MTLEERNSEGVALTSAFISSLDDAARFCHSFRLFMASSVSSNFSFLSEIPILKHKPARRKRRQRRRQKHRRHHRKWNHFFHLLFPHTRSPLSPNIRLISPCPIFSPNQTAKQLHSRFPSSTSILFYICGSANAGRTPYVSLSVLTGRRQPFTRSTP